MYKKGIALLIVCNLFWQIIFAPTIFAQTKLIDKVKNAITGKSLSMTDSNRIYLFNNIATLNSYAGKRINSITIEQHNFSINIDSKESNLKNFFTKLGNQLHSNSNTRAIRENLFFNEWNNCAIMLIFCCILRNCW